MAIRILVEGKDDSSVISHLLNRHKISGYDIVQKEGLENLLATLPIELKGSGIDNLLIIVDTDTNIEGHWQAIRNILIESGLAYLNTSLKQEQLRIKQMQ